MKKQMDYSLFVAIIFLLSFGLVMLYSASSYEAQMNSLPSYYYLLRQFIFVVIGFVLMLILSKINHKVWSKFALFGYLLSFVLIALVFTSLGTEKGGAQRWIEIFGISFQPVEFAKIAIILYLANLISKLKRPIEKFSTIIGVLLRIFPMLLLVIFGTNNLSSAIIIFVIAIVMLFISSPKYMQFIAAGGLAIFGIALVIFNTGFRSDRIDAWRNPETEEMGYQALQSLYAIGSGNVFGKGLGNSVQKLGFVPEVENDMIFSIICEELGLFGAIGLILMFVFMIWRLMIIANKSEDIFGSFLVIGIMAHVAIQVILNIAVVTNTIPNTGVTLPFVSSGGTAAMFLLIEMGIALAVSRNIKYE